MTILSVEKINEALAGVIDPEIHRPITDLGMVENVSLAKNGTVTVSILLTTSICSLRDTITAEVKKELFKLEGVSAVNINIGVMNDEQRKKLRKRCAEARRNALFPSPKKTTPLMYTPFPRVRAESENPP